MLPRVAREALGVKPGGKLLVIVEEGNVCLLTAPENWSEFIYGLSEEVWRKLGGGEAFLAQERVPWESKK